ncbi:multicopper oxidase [Sphaerobolus stellatus SS14]|nr:multicopper oxidase [Sphaerobolus stellatus SS14]
MVFIKFSVLGLLSSLSANAAVVTQTFHLTSQNIAPDGFRRPAAVINGQFPGPVLKANKGDTVFVNVVNNLNDPNMRKSTSIHWHGILQPRNAQNDGSAFVTQCPIAPDHKYTYQLALGDQAGTFWYHSHLSTQYADGIRGPIVIYDPHDPQKYLYDVDSDQTIITLADWYHTTALVATNQWLNQGGNEPVPDSGLINGAGRYGGGPAVPYSRINVSKGLRYRFRLLSLAAEGAFDWAIDNHSMTIIEVDGINTVPYTVDTVHIASGQRYSVVVAANKPINNYWIRATQTVRGSLTSPNNPNFNGTDVYAVLHYAGASNNEPTVSQPGPNLAAGLIPFKEYMMQPLVNPAAPGGSGPADLTFNFTFTPGNNRGTTWTINGIQYQPPKLPTLLKILSGASTDADFGPNENTFVLPFNSTIEVIFTPSELAGSGHPFHLHGQAFSVIQSGDGGPPNFINPPRRDVVVNGAGTPDSPATRIRFRTDNPGPWFLHCHIDWHLETGLAVVFAEDPNGIRSGRQSVQPNAAWSQLCSTYNSLKPSDQ